MVLALQIAVPSLFPQVMHGGDPWGIPSIYPAALVSIGTLIVVSLLTAPPAGRSWRPCSPSEREADAGRRVAPG
jgi:hypothetical protein